MSQRTLSGYKYSSLVGKGGTAQRSKYLAAKMAADMAARRAIFATNRKPPAPSVVAANAGFLRNRATSGMRVEKKVIDIVSTGYNIENTGTQLQLLNGCVAGSQNYQRIGRKINLKSLQIHGKINVADNNVAAGVTVRLLIVFDKQSNGAAPTYSDIIKSQSITPATSSTVFDMVNLDNRDRFEIIRDLYYTLGGIDTTATQTWAASPLLTNVNLYIKLGNRETVYNAGTAGSVGDIQSGALYFFLIADQANAAGASANLSCRTRFVDM